LWTARLSADRTFSFFPPVRQWHLHSYPFGELIEVKRILVTSPCAFHFDLWNIDLRHRLEVHRQLLMRLIGDSFADVKR